MWKLIFDLFSFLAGSIFEKKYSTLVSSRVAPSKSLFDVSAQANRKARLRVRFEGDTSTGHSFLIVRRDPVSSNCWDANC